MNVKDYFDNDIKIGDHVLTLNNVGRQGIELYFGIVVRMTGQRISVAHLHVYRYTYGDYKAGDVKLVTSPRHSKRLVVLKNLESFPEHVRETLEKIEAYISDMD